MLVLLTYERLQSIGLVAVVIYKVDSDHYEINFTRSGSYEQFKQECEVADIIDEAGGEPE